MECRRVRCEQVLELFFGRFGEEEQARGLESSAEIMLWHDLTSRSLLLICIKACRPQTVLLDNASRITPTSHIPNLVPSHHRSRSSGSMPLILCSASSFLTPTRPIDTGILILTVRKQIRAYRNDNVTHHQQRAFQVIAPSIQHQKIQNESRDEYRDRLE